MAIPVDAADLGLVTVVGGAEEGTEPLWMRAHDGTDWSVWEMFTLTTTGFLPAQETIATSNLASGGPDDITDPEGVDVLPGLGGDNAIDGAASDDALARGAGNDLVLGDGDNLFVFGSGDGQATTSDFAPGPDGSDAAQLTDLELASLLEVRGVARDDGVDTTLPLDADTAVTLIGVRASELADDDFLL